MLFDDAWSDASPVNDPAIQRAAFDA